MSQDFLSTLIEYFLIALIPIVVPPLYAWAYKKYQEATAYLKSAQPKLYTVLTEGAELFVQAAEQAGDAGLIKDKKAYAVNATQAYINALGFKNINVAVIEGAVEAAVKAANFSHVIEPEAAAPVVETPPAIPAS